MTIEQEMEIIRDMQLSKRLPNPMRLYFKGDDIDIETYSFKTGLISFSSMDKSKGNTYLRMLYIIPDERGKGEGSHLVNKLIESCKLHGIKGIETESENNSIGFFEKLGFVMMEGQPDNRMILEL